MRIQIGYIFESPELQTRSLDPEQVALYAELMLAGVKFPAIRCRQEGKNKYWLWDGYHRLAAVRKAGFKDIEVWAEPGTLQQAIWDSYSANATCGFPRTTQQKQEAIIKALKHPRGQSQSTRDIAKHVGVHHSTVAAWKMRLERGDVVETNCRNPTVETDMDQNSSMNPGVDDIIRHSNEEIVSSPKLIDKEEALPTPALPSVITGRNGKQYRIVKGNKKLPTFRQKLFAILRELHAVLSEPGAEDYVELKGLVEKVIAADEAAVS